MEKKLLFLILLSMKCYPQSGSFDNTYGTQGIASFCYSPSGANVISDAAFQSSGKTVVYGVVNGAFVSLMRWNVNGTLDTNFGLNGILSFVNNPPFTNGGYSPGKMIIQPDDKIIIMGLLQNSTYPNAYWVARLLPDGTFDSTFDNDGYTDFSFGTQQDRGRCIALQADGKIIVGGTSGDTSQYFSMARLNSNGSLDTTFGIGGKVRTEFNNNQSHGSSIAVQPDGRIILGGYTVNPPHGYDFGLVRYDTNGNIDTSFGNNGKVITTIDSLYSDWLTDLIIEPDGKIIAGGFTSFTNNPWMCMVRYLPNGIIDTSFGTNGIVINNDDNSRSCSIARQVDGKYLMGGCYDGLYFLIIRYNYDGTKDSSFGNNGVVNAFPLTYGAAIKVLIQPDNKIIASGGTSSSDFTQNCPAVVRLNPGTLSNELFDSPIVNVYPNPTSGVVQFDNSETQYETICVYNYFGQQVMESTNIYFNTNSGIDLSNLATGVYVLRFEGTNGTRFVKVAKE